MAKRIKHEAVDIATCCEKSSNPVRGTFFVGRPAMTLEYQLTSVILLWIVVIQTNSRAGLCFEDQCEVLLTLRLN